jgi:alkanesulfonate monooxygenase SsuD/methylene tetrahydromethanopterin reductase-like flavin-dependent oxidoreductase (luciferase family)
MPQLFLRFDMRSPAFGASRARLYREMLDMVAWADRVGFAAVRISEHHGSDDGYLPAPLVAGAAIAARTTRIRIWIAALVLTYHDPVAVAEQVAVLDTISNGRLDLTLAAGYVPTEMAMFGLNPRSRAAQMEVRIAALRAAWKGDAFEYAGRRARVSPSPIQKPHPPLFIGGSTEGSARRAARLGVGFDTHLAALHGIYADAARALGAEPNPLLTYGPTFMHVTHDPAGDWARIAPHAIHETNEYGKWAHEAQLDSSYVPVTSAEELRARGTYAVVTPSECLALAQSLGPSGVLLFHPLMAGLDPELSWRSLRLFAAEVLPKLAVSGPATPAAY